MRRASCVCGRIEVTCEGEPVRVSMCFCHACQKRTGSVVGAQARFPREAVTIRGEATEYVRIGDEGTTITTRFCPVCGSTVWYELDAIPGFIAVTLGCFADKDFPAPTVGIYESRKHPWMPVPATVTFQD